MALWIELDWRTVNTDSDSKNGLVCRGQFLGRDEDLGERAFSGTLLEASHPLRPQPHFPFDGSVYQIDRFLLSAGESCPNGQVVGGMVGKKQAPAQVGVGKHLSQFR